MPDIFELALEKKQSQVFERALEKKTLFERIDKAVPKLVRNYIKSHQIKPPQSISLADVLSVVQTEVKKIPIPEKVIEKEIKVIEKKDDTKYADEKLVGELREEIKELRKKIDETPKNGIFGNLGVRGGKIIPSLSHQEGKFLSNTGNKLIWAEAGSISGSSDVYTPTNVTADRSFDATDTSLDELANVLGSLIQSLKGTGIIQ